MGYDKPPWKFGGRAIYQLQLVKSKEARKYVPEQLKLVECFGYTLGGLYLARYDKSPVGPFDEMVVLAGLVWNAPTSCAWASHVFVNNKEARDHGLKEVGLPSAFVKFSNHPLANMVAGAPKRARAGNWWAESNKENMGRLSGNKVKIDIFGDRRNNASLMLDLPGSPPPGQWRGPTINMTLPSFSGHTFNKPHLLKYSLDMNAAVRLSKSIQVVHDSKIKDDEKDPILKLKPLLSGKPLIAIAFDKMQMNVRAPKIVASPTPTLELNPSG
eukprot:CAMPEP_0196584008 /NCGR_PEP_ID=MMETSP1081-20130531/45441_1 /TAXON_ID=36882 /ORGANISM="Pyramimonas amylifera, Strain CCMP720" /LENGTH=270 /DNA_ID=CAMNT_0041905075 /DNA_START=1 /DNA_END=813 /DNA_ORIENTATION=+